MQSRTRSQCTPSIIEQAEATSTCVQELNFSSRLCGSIFEHIPRGYTDWCCPSNRTTKARNPKKNHAITIHRDGPPFNRDRSRREFNHSGVPALGSCLFSSEPAACRTRSIFISITFAGVTQFSQCIQKLRPPRQSIACFAK